LKIFYRWDLGDIWLALVCDKKPVSVLKNLTPWIVGICDISGRNEAKGMTFLNGGVMVDNVALW